MPSIWFVTGCSSGFGRLIVEQALAQGDTVIATLRKPPALAEPVTKYPASQLLVLQLDVVSADEVTAAFEQARAKFGRIDIVVNNAGVVYAGGAESVPEKDGRTMFDINFWGASRVGLEAVKFFREVNQPQGGLLLNISSTSGISATPLSVHYAASKHAVEAFFEGLRLEIDPRWNIQILNIEPGIFSTDANNGVNVHYAPLHPAYVDMEPTHILPQIKAIYDLMAVGTKVDISEPTEFVPRFFKLIELAQKERDLPLHVPIGLDALAVAQNKIKLLQQALGKYTYISEGLSIPTFQPRQ